ncbi:MAG: hypothetical protein ACPL3B_02535 [Fervidobacterium sp.]
MVQKNGLDILISFLLGVLFGVKKDTLTDEEIYIIFSILEEEGIVFDEKILQKVDDSLDKYNAFTLGEKILNGKKQTFYS